MVWTRFAPWSGISSPNRERTMSEEEFLMRELYPWIYQTGGFVPNRDQLGLREQMTRAGNWSPSPLPDRHLQRDMDNVDAVKHLEQEMEDNQKENMKEHDSKK